MCLLFCFVLFWILCCVVCEKKKKKKIVDDKKKRIPVITRLKSLKDKCMQACLKVLFKKH